MASHSNTLSETDSKKYKIKHKEQKEPEICGFYIPIKTIPRNFNTSKGYSKNPEWLQIEGCPCKVISIDYEYITLNSFSSTTARNFRVSLIEFKNNFIKCPVKDGYITNLDKYPEGKILESEFISREKVKELKKNLETCVKNSDDEVIKDILGDKFWQLFVSQGSPYIGINKYNEYKNGKIKLNPLSHFGSSIFNRNSRWVPPIDITYEEFKKSPSYPAPLGIRPKDFCLPSELIKTIKELIKQIMAFDNIDSMCLETILPRENDKKHKCLWCGDIINAHDYTSVYGSKDNFIEICHRDPNQRFLETNMYWGHGECNRRQGGYSEEERIEDALRLLRNNPDYAEKYKSINPFN